MRKSKSPGATQVGSPALSLPAGDAAGLGADTDSLLQTLPWGVVVLDAHGTVLRLNQQAAHWWGLPQQVLQGQALGPATAGTLPADLQQALQQVSGSPAYCFPEFFLPEQQQWIAMASARQEDDWVVYWQDITAQKQGEHRHHAQQAVSHTLLRHTEIIAHTGSYEVELATGHVHFSDGLFRLYGEEPDAFTPTLLRIDSYSHPDDKLLVHRMLARATADRQPYQYQRRIYRPDGQLRILETHGRVECDMLGQPVKLLGLVQDVTEREQAAQDLLRATNELARHATDNYLTLYRSMDEGFCIVEIIFDAAQRPLDYRFLDVNPAFEKQTGLYGALGKTISELVPAIEPLWADLYGRVARTGEPTRFEANVESMSRWFDINAFPIGPLPNRHVAVLFTDITERKRTEEALHQSEARYRSLFTNMEQGFCLIEKVATPPGEPSDYRYVAVNPAFTRHTGLTDAVGKTIRQLVPKAELRIMATYDEVVTSGEPRQFESYVAALDLWMEAEVMLEAQSGHLAVLFSNVSERHRAEQALRDKKARKAFLLALNDALQPVADAQEIQAVAARLLGEYLGANQVHYDETQGERLTAIHRAGIVQVVTDSETDTSNKEAERAIVRQAGIGAYITVPLLKAGNRVATLAVHSRQPRQWTADEVQLVEEVAGRTWAAVERARAEEALRRSEEDFRLLVTATSDTVYRMSADWTHLEQIISKDFLADIPGPTRTWMEEYIPVEDLPQVKATIAEAIGHHAPFELEHRVRQADGSVAWTYSRAIPMLDARGELTGWLGTAKDVSPRKLAEQQLLDFNARLERQVAERTQALSESQTRLQSVFDSVTTAIALLRAVRAADGRLLDFEYVLANPVAQAYNPEQLLIGQYYGDRHPGIHRTPIFEQLVAVVETGRRADFEVHYDHEGYNHWYRLVGVKLGDGLLFTSEDITARKLLEQEQARSLTLLQESEAAAGMGSWDYDLATQELIWSDGLYRLLGRPVGSPVRPQLFLDAVLDDDRPAAARFVHALNTGTCPFDAPLRLRIGEAVKTVRFKAVPLPYTTGPPTRVLGVCLDVSDVQRLEDENLAMKLDRHKELLLAILQAQEDERRRLGEVLHNGLGQVLYATKLRLDQLDTPALHALPILTGLHQEATRLLAEAMRQNRTLAHELVPTSLTDFGLATAVRDICQDLSTPQLRLGFQIWGEEQELPQPLQVALFRLAQELAHNIVRHARATQATLELETLPGWVSLRAEDNGQGFDPLTVAEGLGLRTVRDAVALLGGTIAIDSSPEFGTHIRLRIPLPLFSL